MYTQEQQLQRIHSILNTLAACRSYGKIRITDLPGAAIRYRKLGYGEREKALEDCSSWDTFEKGMLWGGRDQHYAFRTGFILPPEYTGKEVLLQVSTGATDIWNTDNPQFIVYLNGQPLCAMDMNHNEVTLTPSAEPGKVYEIGLYAYSNSAEETNFLEISAAQADRVAEKIYYDLLVPYEAAVQMEASDQNRIRILKALSEAVNMLELWEQGSQYTEAEGQWEETDAFHQSAAKASAWLAEHLYGAKSGVVAASVGHTHIDVAWKWPVRQTREKAIRSFSTVLHLMDRYPEYRFMSSTPQLYEFVREDAPELFARIRERVQEGRFEPEGSMWLEADCNLISGESMVRQILYGKKYFREQFGAENEVLWLPDVFGYSAAMPQIMKKSGIRYFMTTKLAWNDTNRIPNDLMYWKGIDGSSVLAYFITTSDYRKGAGCDQKQLINYTYNGRQNASQVMGTWQAFQNKELTDEVLTCYGFGDGGGGPTAQMLEESRRMEAGIPGCPETRQTSVKDFFHRLEKNIAGQRAVPVWNGELYLEYHRGTYTSMAENKAQNRRSEFLNQEAEAMQLMSALIAGTEYPQQLMEEVWKLTLLNQFHDILPGSAIQEVYEESAGQYEDIRNADERLIYEAARSLTGMDGWMPENGKKSLLLFNLLGFARSGAVFVDEETGTALIESGLVAQEMTQHTEIEYQSGTGYLIQTGSVPGKGFRIVQEEMEQQTAEGDWEASQDAEGVQIRTPFYEAQISAAGELTGLYDLEAGRQLRRADGAALNHLQIFQDRPLDYDCWNIDATYEEKEYPLPKPGFCRLIEQGTLRMTVMVQYQFLKSTIVQEIHFYHYDRRIDFETTLDWQEHQMLLKAAFPLDILSDHVTAEIQFGNVSRGLSRNTGWDQARFEACAHKWIDLSEADYGAAILNDGRFGYDATDQQLRLTLLKSGVSPNPQADLGFHHFTYSLYPHMGDYRRGRVTEEAYALNVPLRAWYADASLLQQRCGLDYSMARVEEPGVYVDTVKPSEDGQAVIVRMYEGYGARHKVHLDLQGLEPESVTECDLMENALQEDGSLMPEDSGSVSFEIRPFEIRSFRVRIKGENQNVL